jgi:nucleotide-binding universal stress UspA family protein
VLVPTDLSDNARDAFAVVQWFASARTELLVAHVLLPPTYPMSATGLAGVDVAELEVDRRADASEKLAAWIKRLPSAHPQVREIVAEGSPATELVRLSNDERVDLVAISTHGHTGLKHLFLGSVAETVVRRASCPVLTVRLDD